MSKEAKAKAELKVFFVFLNNNLPQRLLSSVDLLDIYDKALDQAEKTGKYGRVKFFDNEGSKNVIAIYQLGAILGVVEGITAPPDKVSDMLAKV